MNAAAGYNCPRVVSAREHVCACVYMCMCLCVCVLLWVLCSSVTTVATGALCASLATASTHCQVNKGLGVALVAAQPLGGHP